MKKNNFFFINAFKFIEFITDKSVYIQIFGEQKHPVINPNDASLSTSDYFDKKIKEATNSV